MHGRLDSLRGVMKLRALLFTVLPLPLALTITAASCSDSDPAAPVADTGTTPIDTGVVIDSGSDAGVVDTGADVETPEPFFDCSTDASPISAPQDLRCTGLYGKWTKKTVATGVRAYKPAVEGWSDGAAKQRWVLLPTGSKIDTTKMDEWQFPVGTKFWKEFSIGGKRIETRLFWKVEATTWTKTVYRWAADESAATRLDLGEKYDPADSGVPYEIPSVAVCEQCHGGHDDKILGFEVIGLGLPGATGMTLATLVSEGLLTTNPTVTTLAIPEDSTGKAAAALGYLHANCGNTCHSANPTANCAFRGMNVRLGYDELTAATPTTATLKAYTTTVNVAATYVTGGTYKRIAPHDIASTGVLHLAGQRIGGDSGVTQQMPPIDSHLADTNGLQAVSAWVTALP